MVQIHKLYPPPQKKKKKNGSPHAAVFHPSKVFEWTTSVQKRLIICCSQQSKKEVKLACSLVVFTWHPPFPCPPAHTIDRSSTGTNLPLTRLQALCSTTGSMACWSVSAAFPPPTVRPHPVKIIHFETKCLQNEAALYL